ncbi:hypothetical protein [Corynebacterium sp. SA-MJD20WY100]|uniref:hypothetical protein n=1 Tax=Corynebacterium sp. SA-MJD20WY100 TaxID=3142969 RepID=UPI003221D0D4
MTTNFDEFARAFRERTARRLLEFEKTLAKAQDDIEKAVHDARDEMRQRPPSHANGPADAPTETRHAAGARPYAAHQTRGTQGRVKSVLRRQ